MKNFSKSKTEFLIDEAKEAIQFNDRKLGLITYQKISTNYLCYLKIMIKSEHRKVLNMLCTMIDLEFYKEKQKNTKTKPL